jgi:acyl-CoA synthetase (AMP-forming)/AMP-acid ligase II
MLIGDMIRFNARRFGDKIAYKDERKTLTFNQVNDRANAMIRALLDQRVKKGDRVAVLLYNCVEYCELLYALPKAGFVMVPLNYRLVGRELTYIIEDSEANTLIYDAELNHTVEEIRPKLQGVGNYIMVDHAGDTKAEALNYEKLIIEHASQEFSCSVEESDVAYILYTSGTTGVPKGAMLTHKNIMTNLYNLLFELQPKPTDKIFNLPPLYHCGGQNHAMSCFFYGCPTVVMKQFEVEQFLRMTEAEKPNILHLVPAMQNMVINHPDAGKYDFDFVELMIYGASSIMRAQLRKSIEIFGCKFLQCAGQTEASPLLTILRPEDHVVDGPEHLVRRLGSAGREVRLTEIKIVDEEGNEVPPGTPGEEIARGDNVMKGYWKMPEATAETIIDGWLHTGDICIADEGGYIYYVDRKKDMINRGGENVYPREIEEVIASHPAVLDVAVIGVPDDKLGEEIMAVVVPKKGKRPTSHDIVGLCEGKLARYKKPRYVEFLEEIPKNASGKILKRQLRRRYEKATLPQKL